jgi:hypothetical protein
MCRIGAEGEGMLYIQQGIAKKKKSLRTHAHHYHGYHVPTEGKKKKRVYTEVILMRITRYSGIWL